MRVLRFATAAAAALVLASAACTALLDRNPTQCRTDDDCARFGDHPFCQNSVCVASGLGPQGCFYGTPQAPADFLNQCSAATCMAFDDCARAGMCDDGGGADVGLVPPPARDAGASTPPAPAPPPGDAAAPNYPSCIDASSGRAQAVYLTGSSNFPPLLAKLSPLIIATGYTPVFQTSSSCGGVRSIFGAAPSDPMISDPPASSSAGKYAAYFGADGSSTPCLLGPQGAEVDVGESDIFSTTCNGYGPPAGGVGEYLGPIQAMAFVVPGKSHETAITAEAARVVFGTGGAGVMPWSNPALFFIRNGNTGTQQMVGHAIGVPADQFWGVDRGTAANVDGLLRVISDDTLAEQAIGIISADYYDSDRANLKALAFRASGQDCAYLPDSSPYKKDKQNVRDGHYPIWGPVHFFARSSNGVPVTPAAQAFVSVVAVPRVSKSLLDAFVASSLVPDCAMQVERSVELGPLSPHAPPFVCGCYFEASLDGAAPAGCTPCNTASDCADPQRPACNLGFCESQ
jgi:hypothetical protein